MWILGRYHGNISYWFQGLNLIVDYESFKRGGWIKKRENQISRGDFFFFFYHSKLMPLFVPVTPVSPDTTLKESCLG